MRASWRVGSLKRGRMSSKRMPGEGKSGNWRKDLSSLILRPGSSEEAVGGEEDCPTWVASCLVVGGCEEVESGMLKRRWKQKAVSGIDKARIYN